MKKGMAQETDEVFELYAVPASGRRAPVKLDPPLPPGSDVEDVFAIRPVGRGVVFAADLRADDVVELFAVPIDGGGIPHRLHPPHLPDADIFPYAGWALALTRDARQALFVADGETDEVFELYASPLPRSSSERRAR